MLKLSTAGEARGLSQPIVGRVVTASNPVSENGKAVLVTDDLDLLSSANNYAAVITTRDLTGRFPGLPGIHKTREIDHLSEGYIVAIEPTNGFVRTVFRPDSQHNILFATERCNSNCLMCSQPPKDHDDVAALLERNLAVISLVPKETEFITITGGEPGLLGRRLFAMLTVLRDSLPETTVHMLSNGRLFAWPEFAAALAEVQHPRFSIGIPLYSDVAEDHDYVVQARGAFDQTIVGLQNLARHGINIEVRIVLHRRTVDRLRELCEFIYRNLTFVDHVALMGLEYIGYTPRNHKELWIDPYDYQKELIESVRALRLRGVDVWIYNHQLCVLDRSLWKYAKKSISDWKNIYIAECERCAELNQCGGLFKWAQKVHSSHIRAFPMQPSDAA